MQKLNQILLLVDFGASFIKIASLNFDTWQINKVKEVPFPTFISLEKKYREVCPKQVLDIFTKLLDEFINNEFQCIGILMSTQMQGFILCNSQGQAKSNYISWQDTRSDEAIKHLSKNELERTGNELKPGMALCNLFWLKENNLLPEASYPVTIADFVIIHLSKAEPQIHNTNAAAFGGFNLETMSWDQEIIIKLGLHKINWPKLSNINEAYTELKWKGKKIPCYISVGDQQAALLGAGLKDKQLSINIGTGSQISMLSENSENGNYQLRPFFADQFLKTITHIPAGRALNILFKLVTEINNNNSTEENWNYIQERVSVIQKTDLKLNLSFFKSIIGETGSIQNITEENLTIGHLFMASYKSMIDNYLILSTQLSPTRNWNSVVLSGGIIQKNKILQEMLMKAFSDKPVELIENNIETLEGLKILARDYLRLQ